VRLLVASRALRDRRAGLAWWIVGLVGYTAMIIAIWPIVDDNEEFQQLAESYPEALQAAFGGSGGFEAFTTPPGFLDGYLFSMILPLLLVGLAAATGAGLLAGEEERGLLDLLLSNPVSRARVVWEKSLVVVLSLLAMAVILDVLVAAAGPLVDLDVGIGELAAATLGSVLYGALHGQIALLSGAVRGAKGLALGIAWGVALVGYAMDVIATLADSLSWLRWASPFSWATADDPIRNGVPAQYALLVGAIAVLVAATLAAFERHDLR
jgi:ABC-2 type transport system permease protein